MTAWHITAEFHFEEELEELHAASSSGLEAAGAEPLGFDAWLEQHAREVLIAILSKLRESGFPGDLRVPASRARVEPLMISWLMVAADDEGRPLEHRFHRQGRGVDELAEAIGHAVEVEVEHAPEVFAELTGNLGISWTLERTPT